MSAPTESMDALSGRWSCPLFPLYYHSIIDIACQVEIFRKYAFAAKFENESLSSMNASQKIFRYRARKLATAVSPLPRLTGWPNECSVT